MKTKFILFNLLLSFAATNAFPQGQTIRGTIRDKQSNFELIGANVIVLGTDPILGTSTDTRGTYEIQNVPLGRQTLKVTYLGYEEITVPNVLVTSGKEVVLNFSLQEQVLMGQEVVITSERDKTATNNEMATVSARSFNVEETGRYAGSRNDPARMAANFAGVSGANDARNDIIIRGNSPLGVLWRLDGIDIPSPNHFASTGSTGGPVSMLNNNLLDKSDFFTGAFPSNYGNALSGVFDLKLRNGNNQKHEFLGQVGFNGFELGAEGPINKESRSSYLVNYRYSTLGLFSKMGVNFGTGAATPDYQDLSFKLDFPTAKAGRFSFWGIGGLSKIKLLDSESEDTDLYGSTGQDIYYNSNTGMTGMSHLYFFNKNTSGTLNISYSVAQNTVDVDSVARNPRQVFPNYARNFVNEKVTVNYNLNKKINARNTLITGVFLNKLRFSMKDSVNDATIWRNITNSEGSTWHAQAYMNWQYRLTDKITFNSGLHYHYFLLNESQSIEPRLGMKWQTGQRSALSVAYGLHGQLQPLSMYFTKTRLPDNSYAETNKNMGMTKAHHFVVGYDRNLTSNMRMKVEAYYQDLYNVPVEQRNSAFSMLNVGADFGLPDVDSLVNKGTGSNLGVELTLERFFNHGYYFLVTTSLFESLYKGSDGIERNTAFNGRYVFNALAGKEFKTGKSTVLAFDIKLTSAGGRRYTPIDLDASIASGSTEFIESQAFTQQFSDYFRADFKVTIRKNHRKFTQEFSLDIQNITNNQNVFSQQFNPVSKTIQTEYQLGLFPIPQYRILF